MIGTVLPFSDVKKVLFEHYALFWAFFILTVVAQKKNFIRENQKGIFSLLLQIIQTSRKKKARKTYRKWRSFL